MTQDVSKACTNAQASDDVHMSESAGSASWCITMCTFICLRMTQDVSKARTDAQASDDVSESAGSELRIWFHVYNCKLVHNNVLHLFV